MRSWPNMRLVFARSCTAALLPLSTVWAQARIDRIIPARSGVSAQRAGALRAERGVVGTTFQPGDLLSALDATKLELRCTTNGATLYRFDGPFRVLVDVPVNGRCQMTVLAGHADVLAEEPSHTTGGTIPLASKGTQYSVDVTRLGTGFACTAVVFEGELIATATGRAATAGNALSWNGPDMVKASATNQQIARSAAVYATFDLATAQAATPSRDSTGSLSQLTALHYAVLAHPTDTAKRVELAKQQIAYKIDEQAAYNLKRANVTNDAAFVRYKIDPATVRQNKTLNDRVIRRLPPTAAASTIDAGATATPADATAAGKAAAGATRGGAASIGAASIGAASTVATSTPARARTREVAAAAPAIAAAAAATATTTTTTTTTTTPALTSRDYFLLAKAADGKDDAQARRNAMLAVSAQATDAKLSDAELKDLRELLGRLP